VLEEFVPIAVGSNATMFACPLLVTASELEEAEGDLSAAQRFALDALELGGRSTAVAHWFSPLVRAARVGLTDELVELLTRARTRATFPLLRARLAEVEAVLAGDRALFTAAADRYHDLELPYDEARCRLDAGDLTAARELVRRFGFEPSPLGTHLAGASAPPAPAGATDR
jgi:hypothetical protein